MATVAVQPFSGTYRARPEPSSFAFAVRHSGVFWYRGSLSDVAATLRGDGDALALEGSARVDSISVVEPPAIAAVAQDVVLATRIANRELAAATSATQQASEKCCATLDGTALAADVVVGNHLPDRLRALPVNIAFVRAWA